MTRADCLVAAETVRLDPAACATCAAVTMSVGRTANPEPRVWRPSPIATTDGVKRLIIGTKSGPPRARAAQALPIAGTPHASSLVAWRRVRRLFVERA